MRAAGSLFDIVTVHWYPDGPKLDAMMDQFVQPFTYGKPVWLDEQTASDAGEELLGLREAAPPAALGILQPFALAVHKGGTHHVEDLVVGDEVDEAEGGQPQHDEIEKAELSRLEGAGARHQPDRDCAQRHEDSEGDAVPEILLLLHADLGHGRITPLCPACAGHSRLYRVPLSASS